MRMHPFAAAAALALATALSAAAPASAQSRSMIYDTDGNGVLSQSEFTSGPMNLGSFGRFDRDNDGGISLAEFMRGLADRLESRRDDGTLNAMDVRTLQIAVMMFN